MPWSTDGVVTGGRVLAAPSSVTDEAHVRVSVSRAVIVFGKLTTLIHNTGIVV
jgi:hypothetical protein